MTPCAVERCYQPASYGAWWALWLCVGHLEVIDLYCEPARCLVSEGDEIARCPACGRDELGSTQPESYAVIGMRLDLWRER